MKRYEPPTINQLLEELGYPQHKLASQQFREALLSEHPGYMPTAPTTYSFRQELDKYESNHQSAGNGGSFSERLSKHIAEQSQRIHLPPSGCDSADNTGESN